MPDIVNIGLKVDSRSGVVEVTKAEREFDKLDKTVNRANKTLEHTTSRFSALKNAIGAFVGIATVTRFMQHLTQVTVENEVAGSRLEGVLRATGFAAGKTAKDIDALSTALSRSTLFDDEAIQNAASVDRKSVV